MSRLNISFNLSILVNSTLNLTSSPASCEGSPYAVSPTIITAGGDNAEAAADDRSLFLLLSLEADEGGTTIEGSSNDKPPPTFVFAVSTEEDET